MNFGRTLFNPLYHYGPKTRPQTATPHHASCYVSLETHLVEGRSSKISNSSSHSKEWCPLSHANVKDKEG